MKCPKCGIDNNIVADSRSRGGVQRRIRVCRECGHRFTTTEYYQEVYKVKERGSPAWSERCKNTEFSWDKKEV